MGTRAEEFVTARENSPRPRSKKVLKKARAAKRTGVKRAEGVTSVRGAGGSQRRPVVAKGKARKASYALESSETGRPSRKSTRPSANRVKPDANLKRQNTRELYYPEARASRAAAKGAGKTKR